MKNQDVTTPTTNSATRRRDDPDEDGHDEKRAVIDVDEIVSLRQRVNNGDGNDVSNADGADYGDIGMGTTSSCWSVVDDATTTSSSCGSVVDDTTTTTKTTLFV